MHMPCTSYAATLSGSREVRFHSASGLTRAELSIAASLAPVAVELVVLLVRLSGWTEGSGRGLKLYQEGLRLRAEPTAQG